jgi:hypothetical protein
MVLAGTGIALSTLLGGCLSNNSILNDDEGSDNESSINKSEFEYDTFQVGALRATHNPLNGATASLDAFTTSNDAYEELPLDNIETELQFDDLAEGQEGTVEDFIERTDYNNGFIVSVITQWPKSNPSGIEILKLDRNDDKITGTAEATGKDPDVGDDAPTFPVTLIRVTAGDGRPSSVEMTITDGSGNEATIDT